jgi:hypothetical protein
MCITSSLLSPECHMPLKRNLNFLINNDFATLIRHILVTGLGIIFPKRVRREELKNNAVYHTHLAQPVG